MKASLIAVVAIVAVSVGAYFAISSANKAEHTPTAKTTKTAQTAAQPAAVVETEVIAEEVVTVNNQPAQASSFDNFARADRSDDLLAANNVQAPRVSSTRAARTATVSNTAAQPAVAAVAAKPAPITVVKNGQTTTYPKGTSITVTGDADTTVDYNGVKVVVPQGQRVVIQEGPNGTVAVSGANMNGVQINDQVINSTGAVTLAASADNNQVQVIRGSADITANGQTRTVSTAAQSAQQTAAKQQTTAKNTAKAADTAASTTVDAPAFVSADIVTDTAQEQATQDVVEEEERELSPSTPH